MDTQAFVRGLILATGAVAIGACGSGETNKRPLAVGQALAGVEDAPVGGQLAGSDPEGKPLTYLLVSQAVKGGVALDSTTGAFTYTPDADANGADSFSFATSDGKRQSAPAVVGLVIAPVNDSPTLDMVAEARNSAETQQVRIPLNARDVDGDVLSVTAVALDPSVVAVDVATDGDALVVTPLQRGIAGIDIVVSDGSLAASARLQFEVGNVVKRREWVLEKPRDHAIELTNVGATPVTFRLRHNGHEVLSNLADAIREVEALAVHYPAQPVKERLWRYVMDSTYHWYPVTAEFWAHDPVTMLNSIGYGFCDDVAAMLASLGSELGYRTQVWDLYGHVVPEIEIDGAWKVFDPDLRVHYRDASGVTVGVAELIATPELITEPIDPVLPPDEAGMAYTTTLAEIYASSSNNRVHPDGFAGDSRLSGEMSLAPGARLSYPGHWVDAPTGVDGEQPAPLQAPASAQARLELPAGFSGPVRLPFVLWGAAGQGVLRISGIDYAVGSPELTGRLSSLAAMPEDVEVTAVEAVTLYYLMNPVRFSLLESTALELDALDAWALQVELLALPEADKVPHASLDVLDEIDLGL